MGSSGPWQHVVTTVAFDGNRTILRAPTYAHPLSAFCITTPYRLFHFDADLQQYCFPAIESGVDFYSAYNVQPQPIPGIILWLFDTGASVHLSPDPRHFYVKHASDITIHGVGERQVTAWAPTVISVLSNALGYITIHTGRVYQLESLGFPILAWPHLAKLGFKAILEQDFPIIRAPLGQGVIPLIHDSITGLLWLAERVHALPTIRQWQRYVQDHSRDHGAVISPHVPTMDMVEPVPTKPDNKENIDHYIKLQQAALATYLSFRHRHSQPTAHAQSPAIPAPLVDDTLDLRTRPPTRIAAEPKDPDLNDNDYAIKHMRSKLLDRKRPIRLRMPAMRLLDDGNPVEIRKLYEFVHSLLGHLSKETIVNAIGRVHGDEILRAIMLLQSQMEMRMPFHACDHCAENKVSESPTPAGIVVRPRRVIQVPKIWIDSTGKFNVESLHHHFQYLMGACTNVGFFLIEGMTYKSQSLFVIARIFNDLGGPPAVVQVDGAGELATPAALKFFTSKGIRRETTTAGQHWQHGRIERRWGILMPMIRCMLSQAGAPPEYFYYAAILATLIMNLVLAARDDNGKDLGVTCWEAHYGIKPNIFDYLLGPFGCLAFLTLTKEQRQVRGIDKAFGVRAISGIYLGCWCHPTTLVCHHFIHDGANIFSSRNNIRTVADVFPLRRLIARDGGFRFGSNPHMELESQGARAPQHQASRDIATDAHDDLKAGLTTTINRTNLKIGEVVWAQLGKPFYPAQVADPSVLDCEGMPEAVTKHKDAKEGYILVHFFDQWDEACTDATKRSYAWIPANKVKRYLEHIGYENKTRTQSFIQAVRIARKVGKIDVDAVVKAYAAVTRDVDRTWNDIMTLKAGGELDQWDRSSAGGNQFTERMFTAMIAHAKAEQADELEAEIRFHSSPEVASMPVYTLGKAELTMLKKQREDKGVKSKELKLRVDKKMHRIVAEQAQESSKEKEIVVAPRKVEAIEFSDPEDFAVAMSPPAFKLVDAYEGASYQIAIPTNFDDTSEIPKKAEHPHMRFVGRKVAKFFPETYGRRKDGKPSVWKKFDGEVKAFDDKTDFFRVVYSDGDREDLELFELMEILVMGEQYGDAKEEAGKTRQELSAQAQQEVINIVFEEEGILNRFPKGKLVRFAEEVQTRFYTPESWISSGESRKAKRKGDAGLLWMDEDSGESEGEEIRNSIQEDERFQIAKECARHMPASQRVAAMEQMGFSNTFAEEENAKVAMTVVPAEKAIEGIMDDIEPKYDDDRDLSFKDVQEHPEREQLLEAARKELEQWSAMDVGVFPGEDELAKIRVRGERILRARMIYKRKYETVVGSDNVARERFVKWKARCAVIGCPEVRGVDLTWSTFAPTIGMTAVRTVISLMCDPSFDVRSYDLGGAYLGTKLDRDVYVKLPPEAGKDAGKIIRLMKAAYGLKSSGRDFIKSLSKKILEFKHGNASFRKTYMDQCIYVFEGEEEAEPFDYTSDIRGVGKADASKSGESTKQEPVRRKQKMILLHYVDDIILCSNDLALRDKFLEHLREVWKITDEGELSRYLGIHFRRSEDGKSWEMSMGGYIDKIGKRFGLDANVRLSDVPMDPGFVLTAADFEEKPTDEMVSEYRSLIGSIGFAAVSVRYDISYAVSALSRHLARPNPKLINEAKRVIRYLIKTRNFSVKWSASDEDRTDGTVNVMFGAVDASYAACQLTRRSHGGWIMFLNHGAVSWKSGLQPMVTLSSCEAEFVALCSAIVEAKYLRQLLTELGYPQPEPTLIWEDNKAAIIVAESETSSASRCKHIDVRFRFIAEALRERAVRVRYVASAENYADIMTKPLVHVKFEMCRDLCSGMKGDLKRIPLADSEDEETVSRVYMFYDEYIHDRYTMYAPIV